MDQSWSTIRINNILLTLQIFNFKFSHLRDICEWCILWYYHFDSAFCTIDSTSCSDFLHRYHPFSAILPFFVISSKLRVLLCAWVFDRTLLVFGLSWFRACTVLVCDFGVCESNIMMFLNTGTILNSLSTNTNKFFSAPNEWHSEYCVHVCDFTIIIISVIRARAWIESDYFSAYFFMQNL